MRVDAIPGLTYLVQVGLQWDSLSFVPTAQSIVWNPVSLEGSIDQPF